MLHRLLTRRRRGSRIGCAAKGLFGRHGQRAEDLLKDKVPPTLLYIQDFIDSRIWLLMRRHFIPAEYDCSGCQHLVR